MAETYTFIKLQNGNKIIIKDKDIIKEQNLELYIAENLATEIPEHKLDNFQERVLAELENFGIFEAVGAYTGKKLGYIKM